MSRRIGAFALLVTVASAGCGGGGSDAPPVTSVTATVRPDAATTVALPDGPTLHFASGSVASATTVTIEVSAATVPAGYELQGRAYELGPSGLTFPAGYVTVTLPIAGSTGAIWVSSDAGYDALPASTIAGSTISAELPHFSTVFAGVACAPASACTPANPCHVGTTTCSGPPACVDTSANVTDGAGCCPAHAGACDAGFCAASTLDGTWKVTQVMCNGGAVPAPFSSWITSTNSFWITQAGDTGYSIWTNGPATAAAISTAGAPPYGCTIRQLQGVVGTWDCQGTGCAAFATAVLGGDVCGQQYDDVGGGPASLPAIPACIGGTVTLDDSGTQCSSAQGYAGPFQLVLVRQ